MLEVAERVTALPGDSPDPAARRRVRSRVLADGERFRTAWVHTHRLPLQKARHRPPSHPFRNLAVMLAALLVAGVAGAVLAFATGLSEPDNKLYGLKIASQKGLVAISLDPVSKAATEVDLAGERFQDAEGMAAKGKGDLCVSALVAYYAYLHSAGDRLASHKTGDSKWVQVRDRLKTMESRPLLGIERGLSDHKDKAHLAQVQAMEKEFAAERKDLDARLNIKTSPGAGPGIGGPAPPPSAKP
jgi:hypothetical protein